VILLDTHVWVWFNMDHPLLSDELREKAPECAVSVISAWEIALLVRTGRLQTGHEPAATAKNWLSRYPFKVLDLDLESVALSQSLAFQHGDLADRFIAATAYRHGARLATNDSRLKALPWLSTISS